MDGLIVPRGQRFRLEAGMEWLKLSHRVSLLEKMAEFESQKQG